MYESPEGKRVKVLGCAYGAFHIKQMDTGHEEWVGMSSLDGFVEVKFNGPEEYAKQYGYRWVDAQDG